MSFPFQKVCYISLKEKKLKRFLVELVSSPSILDNITNLQVFQDDQHILEFIMCNSLFKGQEIDDTPNDKPKDDELEDEDGIINFKTNTIHKGMVEFECIFSRDESTCSKRNVEEKRIKECDLYNLGIEEDPKLVIIDKASNSKE